MSEKSEREKIQHQRDSRMIAALTIEHGLRFLDADDPTRALIEEDIRVVRTRDRDAIAQRHKESKKREKSYTVPGLLLQGSEAMLWAGKHRGYVSGGWLDWVTYFPEEAGFLSNKDIRRIEDVDVSHTIRHSERKWQDRWIRPLIHRLFNEWGTELNVPSLSDIATVEEIEKEAREFEQTETK